MNRMWYAIKIAECVGYAREAEEARVWGTVVRYLKLARYLTSRRDRA